MVGAVGGAIGSLWLQFMVPALSGFDDWHAILAQMPTAFVSGVVIFYSGHSAAAAVVAIVLSFYVR
jgi:hypothetical protein